MDTQVVLLDIAFLAFIAAYALVIILFRDSVTVWQNALRDLAIASGLVAVSSVVARRGSGTVLAIIRGFLVIGACGILFKVAERVQHVLVSGWMDDRILSLDSALWGMETSVALQRFVQPFLTEWMMFAYVMYIPLLPAVVILCARSSGERAVNDYLLNLSLAYMISFIGFMLFPLATQMHYNPMMYSVPLDGWVFTWLGEMIRTHLHEAGAALPSPHCAAGTVMLIMSYRYSRRAFYFLLPIIITLYMSTVYCRYHYLWDTVAGILVGVSVVKLTPMLLRTVTQKPASEFPTRKEAKP
jgi:membrane-associated phospholipid phosphatase